MNGSDDQLIKCITEIACQTIKGRFIIEEISIMGTAPYSIIYEEIQMALEDYKELHNDK